MQLMAWNPHFETGLELVDTQHHALVDMINLAAPHLALNDDVAKRAVGPLLDNLTKYAVVHFRDEERLMAQKGMAPDYLAHHHVTHQAFVDEIIQMRRQYEEDGSLTGTELLRFLSSWLSFHILEEDQRMAAQLKDMAAGQTALMAYEHANQPPDGAHAVYHSALLDLFTLLTERNQKLVLANEAVRKTQAALTMANQSLELRVQERTRDLADTVTRLKQTQAQLLQSEKMAAVGQLAAGVAHEINNPIGFVTSNLGSLSGYVGQLFDLIGVYQATNATLTTEQQSSVAAARQKIDFDYLQEDMPGLIRESREGLERVKKIVSGLRDFSSADNSQWAPADLNQVLESALGVVASEIKSKASVAKALASLPPVSCMASQIKQVLVNLLTNAAQAIDKQGLITVRSGAQSGQVWLEVCDTGCGMAPDVQKRIFEPFYTTQAVGKGTGLGLSTSWEIIKQHHGELAVHSEPGKGSTFRVSLPVPQPN
ncbi:MAG: bacteriohemerythrin [Rhodoferax sp.]|uniref:bacteriohemerythrin n=1 Tax=Rhodoferax sp. TaxID=50421 RepID=UPI00262F2E15|nr:bacteriohemerythrin [Rhodoferax sp.]MDD2878992.1 bacteriohemerythrin [Rhodoferax sp.]